MASKTWADNADLTAYLGYVKGVDATAQTNAIARCSGRINTVLKRHGITPSDITAVTYPDDEEYLKNLCLVGAAVDYTFTTTGSVTGVQHWVNEWRDQIRSLETEPIMLDAYSETTGSATVKSHTTGKTQTTIDTATGRKRRMYDPGADRNYWENF